MQSGGPVHRSRYARAGVAAVFAAVLFHVSASAQITTDTSFGLPKQILSGPLFSIGPALGTLSGNNLFHSFEQFNLATNESATFTGPSTLVNIVARVTGGSGSSIDGTIATQTGGSPSLFLVNPAGVIFGPNASLNVEGSFHVSTADYLKFADGVTFVSNGSSSLFSTAAPAAFGFLNANPAGVLINGSSLNVGLGSTLNIVGGQLMISGASLKAPGGTLAATSAASQGELALSPAATEGTTVDTFGTASISGSVLDSADNTASAAGNIYVRASTLTVDGSVIGADNHTTGPGGTIVLVGEQQLTIAGDSAVQSYANATSNGSTGGSAASIHLIGGDVAVEGEIVAENKKIDAGGEITQSFGDGGMITIDAGSLTIGESGLVSSSTFSIVGEPGDIIVNVDSLLSITGGIAANSYNTTNGGDGGDITVTADSITLAGGSIVSNAAGTHDAGDITVSAAGVLTVTGGLISASNVQPLVDRFGTFGGGDGGQIKISAGSITLAEGASVESIGAGQGRSGTITIDTAGELGITASEISVSSEGPSGAGGGDVTIGADSVTIADGGSITSETNGGADGGNIILEAAGALTITDGWISASNTAEFIVPPMVPGNAGHITIHADSITLEGGGRISTTTVGVGNGGSISLTATQAIEIQEGEISTDSAYPLFLHAPISPPFGSHAHGDAGTITIDAGSVTIGALGEISSTTRSEGKGGDVTVTVAGAFNITGGGISANALAYPPLPEWVPTTNFAYGGDAGDVEVSAGSLTLADGGSIESTTEWSGNGGSVDVSAGTLLVSDSSRIRASTLATDFEHAGDAGDVTVNADSVTLAHGGRIESTTSGAGDGGNIVVHALESLDIREGFGLGVTGISASQLFGEGSAGSITIEAGRVTITQGGELSTSTFGSGSAGDISINASEVSLEHASISARTLADGDGGSIVIDTTGSLLIARSSIVASADYFGDMVLAEPGDAGQITISANDITLSDGGQISAQGVGQTAGDIVVRATEGLEIHGNPNLLTPMPPAGTSYILIPTGILADSSDTDAPGGTAGTITIDAGSITIDGTGRISSNTTGYGTGGDIAVNVTGALEITGDPTSEFFTGISASTSSIVADSGDAGHVAVNAGSVVLSDSGQISSSTSGSGHGGNVEIHATGALSIHGNADGINPTGISADSLPGAAGNAGTVTVDAGTIAIDATGTISSSTYGSGDGGDVTVDAGGALTITGDPNSEKPTGIAAISALSGDAGRVSVIADTITIAAAGSITSDTSGVGNGGDVTVNAAGTLTIIGDPASIYFTGISSDTLSESMGGDAGHVVVNAGSVSIAATGLITSDTFGSGNGGDVTVDVDGALVITGDPVSGFVTGIFANTWFDGPGGDAGQVTVSADSLAIGAGGSISGDTYGSGNGGDVTVSVAGALTIAGDSSSGLFTGISAVTLSSTEGGDAGQVTVNGGTIALTEGGQITSTTFGSGNGGDVTVNAVGELTIIGNPDTETLTGISANSRSTQAGGDAGQVTVQANSVFVTNSGEISTNSNGPGVAGDILIKAQQVVVDNGTISSDSSGTGASGSVIIDPASISILNDSNVSAKATGGGASGNVELTADVVTIANSIVSTESASGGGGNITITAPVLLQIIDGVVSATVQNGAANAGNVTINAGLLILDQSLISANAFEGQGGKLLITARGLIATPGSVLSASSERGVNGEVDVNTLSNDVTSGLVELSGVLVQDASRLACTVAPAGPQDPFSNVIVHGRGEYDFDPDAPGIASYSLALSAEDRLAASGTTGRNAIQLSCDR
jgi:filamentous hemagglutinin family protein